MDFSTINLDKLRKLPKLKLPVSYCLQGDPGNGCSGDPPGYPTYFTRNVYTRHGNSPRKGAQMVITVPGEGSYVVEHSDDWKGVKDWEEYRAKIQARLKSLYLPLPEDHPRVKAWMMRTYIHLNHCFRDVERTEHGTPGTLIYPIPYYRLKPYITQATDVVTGAPVYSEEYLKKVNDAADAFNAHEKNRAASIAIPDNHLAVIRIREHYPEHEPRTYWILHADQLPTVGQWWETEAEQPSVANCARSQRWGNKHPFNGTWCQWCGRKEEENAKNEN